MPTRPEGPSGIVLFSAGRIFWPISESGFPSGSVQVMQEFPILINKRISRVSLSPESLRGFVF